MKNQQNQVKNGECANTKACDIKRSDAHNLRRGRLSNLNIRTELTIYNEHWLDERIPDLKMHDKRIREDYYGFERKIVVKGEAIRYHKHLPRKGKTKASPIKETILLLPSNGPNTSSIVRDFIKEVEKDTQWRCIRFFIHRDEFYFDPDTDQGHPNCHAHIVWDTYNWKTHECIHVSKKELRAMQDTAARITGMPRGRDARLTKARHLAPPVFKVKQDRVGTIAK